MPNSFKPMQLVKPITIKSFANTRDGEATYYNDERVLSIAGIDVIRYGYDPYSGVPVGYIFEGAATNALTKSIDFTNSVWIKNTFNTVSISTDSELAPDNSVAQLMSASSYPARIERDNPLTGDCTFSIHVKKKSGSGMFTMSGAGSGIFNLATGTIFAGDGATIQKLNNDWYRCSISGTASDPLTISVTGGAFEYYIFGAQLEAGIGKTSFIYTNASTVTRAADVTGTPPYLISTNIPETDNPDYVSGTTYAVNQEVMVRDTYHRNYKSNISENTGNYPPTHKTQWRDVGATVRWRMFDMKVGADLQSTNAGLIDVSVALADAVSNVTLLNVQGVTATLRMYGYTSGLIFEQTVELLTDPADCDWYEYYWGARRPVKTVTFTDLPQEENTTLQVIINGEDEEEIVALGKLIIGEAITLGFTEYGSSIGIRDYSTKEADEFGNYFIQERRFVGKADLKVVVDHGGEDFVRDTLADARATYCLYIGHSDFTSTIIWGFYNDFSILFSTPASSYCSLSLTGG